MLVFKRSAFMSRNSIATQSPPTHAKRQNQYCSATRTSQRVIGNVVEHREGQDKTENNNATEKITASENCLATVSDAIIVAASERSTHRYQRRVTQTAILICSVVTIVSAMLHLRQQLCHHLRHLRRLCLLPPNLLMLLRLNMLLLLIVVFIPPHSSSSSSSFVLV